jgi:hypothetical protein
MFISEFTRNIFKDWTIERLTERKAALEAVIEKNKLSNVTAPCVRNGRWVMEKPEDGSRHLAEIVQLISERQS